MAFKKKQRQNQQATSAAETPSTVRLRLAPGIHAVQAAEVEVRELDGGRIAGGNGVVEFNLWVETWVDIVVRRP